MKDLSSIVEVLENAPWFAHVGSPLTLRTHMTLERVSTWKEALLLHGLNATSNAYTQAANMQTRELSLKHRVEYRKWNIIVAEVHEAIADVVLPRLDSMIDCNADIAMIEGGRDSLKYFVRWDIVSIAMEYAYSDLIEPRFYTSLLNVYQAGHFPCSWDEVWPNGKLWVY